MDRFHIAIFLLLISLNILLAFYQLFALRLFNDEGQYLLIAKRMLDGWVPYRDIIENKPLGMYLSLIPAVILGGKDIAKLRLYSALIVGLTSFFIFLIGERFKNRIVGLISAGAFICMEAFPGLYGYLLMAEPISNLFVVILFYILLVRKPSYANLFLIGALAAISCSIRQPCVFVFVPLAFYFLYYSQKLDKRKALASILGGIGVVIIPMLLYLILNSALGDAIYWCFDAFIRFGNSGLETKIERFSEFSFFFFAFILPTIITLEGLTREKEVIWVWLLSALVMVQLGYSWRHYYLSVVPPLSILAGVGIWKLYEMQHARNGFRDIFRGVFIFLVFGILLSVFAEFSAIVKLGRIDKNYEKELEVSEFISSHTNKSDGIFVLSCDSYIYYLTDRKPVTRMTFLWMGQLPFMNDAEKNEFVFKPLVENKPKYVVMNPLLYWDDSVVIPVRNYLDEKYTHVGDWEPYQLYERKQD
jgi:4-amino-4-deoxy-L-arabinose transferase-like glycosyltransferase